MPEQAIFTSIPQAFKSQARAQEIQRQQEQALTHLPPHTLYIALWLRNDPPPLNDFHWAFYSHQGPSGGTMYQVKQLGEGWITDHGLTGCIFKSLFLCCLLRIGNVPAEKGRELDQAIRSRDDSLNEIPDVTCRVWLFEVMAHLVQRGFVHCDSLEALRTECLAFANQVRFDASRNVQPRPLVVATKCS